MKKTKSKMGRPKKLAGKKQSAKVTVNLVPREFAQLKAEARKARLSLSAYLSDCWRARHGMGIR